MKIGIIGAGNVAMAHLNAIRASPGVEATGVYDDIPGRARAIADRYACTAFDRPEQLYDAADGVIVASPNHTHAGYALDAMRHGRPVLCEKPMTTTEDEARQMLQAASQSPGLEHAVGFNYRYSPVVRQLGGLLAAGRLGRLRRIELAFQRDSAFTRAAFTWRDSELGRATSGAMGDLGVHLIDLLPFLTGSPVEASTCRGQLRTNVPHKEGRRVMVDDDAVVSGQLSNGTIFHLTASKSAAPEETGLSILAIGALGEFSYHSRKGTICHSRSRTRREVHSLHTSPTMPDPPGEVYGWAGTFRAQVQEWAALVGRRAPRRRLANIADGLRAQAVLDHLLHDGHRPPILLHVNPRREDRVVQTPPTVDGSEGPTAAIEPV